LKLWIDFQSHNLILLLLIFISTFIIAFFSYRFTLPPISIRKRVFLLVLRWLALFCLILALSEPLLGIARKSLEKPKIALLLDSSKSMNIKDKSLSRKEVLQGLLGEKSLKDFLSKTEIYSYLFSDSLIPFDLSRQFPPFNGEATAIGNSLEKLKENLKDKDLSAVILLSDGANNSGADPLAISKNYNLPIYSVGIGEFVPFKDLSVEKLDYNEIAYSGEKDTIKVTLKNQGYKGIKIPVYLQEEKKTLAQKEAILNFSGEIQQIELVFEPETKGIHRYQVVIPRGEGETFLQNNLKSFTQKVLDRKFKLLLVSQSLSWEYTFLKRFLSSNKDISFESLVFSKSNQPVSGELSAVEKLKACDLLILLDSPQFLEQNQKAIRELIYGKGISILLIVGEEFYKRGGLLSSLDFLPFDMIKGEKPLSQTFNLTLTQEGKVHPVTRLSDDPEENLSLWANLPPFEQMIPLKEKAGAKILALFNGNQEVLPGIIVKEQEKGKIEVLSFSPLWKWDFLLWGIGQDNSAYKRLWENSFRWLLSKEDLDRFKIFTDKNVYKRGEEIKFASRFFDESYQKIKGAEIKIKVLPKGKAADSITFDLVPDGNGDYAYTVSFLPPGAYLFKGEARQDGILLGTSSGGLEVENTSLEDEDLKPDKELLQQIALLSGGEYSEPENFSSLLKRLNLEKRVSLKTREIPLWTQPFLLLLFILFLSTEWFFRKRFQLL
jgi:hypothetical protein